MGSLCSGGSDQPTSDQDLITKSYEKIESGVQISIKVGEPEQQSCGAVVVGTDNYLNNQTSKNLFKSAGVEVVQAQLKQKMAEQNGHLKNGDIIHTTCGKISHISYIFFAAVPLWRGGTHQEIEKISESIRSCLELAVKLKLDSIVFTDFTSSLFGIPQQDSAEAIMREVVDFCQTQKTCLQNISFISQQLHVVMIVNDQLNRIYTGQSNLRDSQASIYSQDNLDETNSKQSPSQKEEYN